MILLVVIGALVYQGSLATYNSGALKLKNFEIRGNSGLRVSDEQIVQAAGVPVGSRLFEASPSKIEGRIRTIPWISKVKVQRLLPSTLRIEVTERRAFMVVVTPGGPYLVDAKGVVLQQGADNLVELRDLPLRALVPGDTIASREFTDAQRVLKSLPRSVRSAVLSISARSIDQLTLALAAGPVVLYGAAEQMAEKNFALQSLLEASPGSGSNALIDVRAPGRPSIRYS